MANPAADDPGYNDILAAALAKLGEWLNGFKWNMCPSV